MSNVQKKTSDSQRSKPEKSEKLDKSARMDSNVSDENDACVVCFKNVEIYSIGECDHPVCYECSTRMRVLCQQNECPICRQVLSKVIFTYDKLPYRELESKNRSEYYSKKYKISFYTSSIQQAFFNLLDHPCPKCNAPPYRTFQGLKNHVRREHDLYYCDLCTDNLKIFTFERRCYTQTELGLHRTRGDSDNRSHRGHPLCEYCNKRYLDRDELFRHLRREHYFCHFCDADGCNEFYRDYTALAEHFRQDHYLCEEGKCATEEFIGAFRTEIDYKAHVASVHGKSLNKQQAKQTRTLQLEITLGPRGRGGHGGEQNIANLRRSDDIHDEPIEASTSHAFQQNQRPVTIDARNEQDFPSLAGAANGPNLSLTRALPLSMRNLSTTSGLARTKENFPALGGSGGGGVVNSGGGGNGGRSQAAPISSMLKKTSGGNTGAIARPTAGAGAGGNNNSGMVIHVSNRPASVAMTPTSTGGTTKKSPAMDFPALPSGKNKKQNRLLESDMLPAATPVSMTGVAAKHRTLVDDYVSVAHPNHFQKIQTVQKEDLETKERSRKVNDLANAPKLTTEDFPSLGDGGGVTKATANWVKPPSVEKKQREIENRKSKVAPAPILSTSNSTKKSNSNNKSALSTPTTNNNNSSQLTEQTTKKDKKNKEKKTSAEGNAQAQKSTGANKAKEKNNNNESKTSMLSPSGTPTVNGNDTASGQVLRPPPGFSGLEHSVKPPPGFQSNVTLNSVAKSPNNLTFTSSLGESYSIVTTHVYAQPLDAMIRNQMLVEQFRKSLGTPESFEEFRQISQNFREGVYKPLAYYEHCQAALKQNFDKVFPELLALLPDISKQQSLYLVHTQRLNSMSPSQRKTLPNLEVCSSCKQVLLHTDVDNHRKMHELKDNFPTLSSATGVPGRSATSNRK